MTLGYPRNDVVLGFQATAILCGFELLCTGSGTDNQIHSNEKCTQKYLCDHNKRVLLVSYMERL